MKTLVTVISVIIFIVFSIFAVKKYRESSKKEKDENQTEQASKSENETVEVKPWCEIKDISQGPETVLIPLGYQAEVSGNGKMYYRNDELQGGDIPFREFEKVSSFILKKYEGENSADTVYVTFSKIP